MSCLWYRYCAYKLLVYWCQQVSRAINQGLKLQFPVTPITPLEIRAIKQFMKSLKGAICTSSPSRIAKCFLPHDNIALNSRDSRIPLRQITFLADGRSRRMFCSPLFLRFKLFLSVDFIFEECFHTWAAWCQLFLVPAYCWCWRICTWSIFLLLLGWAA